ncbi:MAG TPA: lamin tail domain-containing protein, partial [Candidatus Kapabacteria bacterium]|nr:lamin tail domain-containing protein [Candidatus Kapabacteria bacterium]
KSIATSQMQQAVFFQDVPLPLSITEHPQWKFLHWRIGDSIISTDKNVIMLPDTESMNIIAEFVQDSTTMGNAIPIVINEIMYKAADSKDMKDWIELTNYGNESYNIGSWILRDNDNSHSFIIPPNTIINPQEYIIIAEDTTKFLQYYPRPTKIIGEFDFGFGRGDQVRLFNAENFLIDSVHYGIISPWDSNADGTGQSLELQSPVLDNTLPEHWHATGNNGGTPGRPNTPGLFVQDIGDNANISIHRNNNVLEIHCTDTPQKLQCSLYSIHGNLLTRIHNIGTQTSIPLTGLSSGIYNVIIQEMATLRIIHRSSFSIIQ